MTKEENIIFDKILDKLDNETKNTLIKLLMTNDKENVWIETIPIYENIMYRGRVIMKRIKEYKYAVGIKHEADSYKGNEPYVVTLELDEDEI